MRSGAPLAEVGFAWLTVVSVFTTGRIKNLSQQQCRVNRCVVDGALRLYNRKDMFLASAAAGSCANDRSPTEERWISPHCDASAFTSAARRGYIRNQPPLP
jgi:hypothetical protein